MKTRALNRSLVWLYLAAFVGIAAASIMVGYIYNRSLSDRATSRVHDELTILVREKERQIRNWHAERLGDGGYLFRNMHGRDLFSVQDLRRRKLLIERDLGPSIMAMFGNGHYSRIGLFDTSGARLFDQAGHVDMTPSRDAAQRMAVRERALRFTDFYRAKDGKLYIDLVIPVFRDGAGGGPWVATYILEIDPQRELYPLMRTWPVPTTTSECVIFERFGDSVVVHAPLRSQPAATPRLRIAAGDRTSLLARASRQSSGLVYGQDHLGVPALAAVSRVAGSPWHIAVTRRQSEAFALLDEQTRNTMVLVFGFTLAVASLLLFLYNGQRVRYHRSQIAAEQERIALREHYAVLMKFANDAMFLVDEQLHFIDANDRVVTLYGYTPEELRGKPIRILRTPQSAVDVEEQFSRIRAQGGAIFETVHRNRDGAAFPVEVSARLLQIEGRVYYQGIIRDISERRKSERRIAQLNRLYTVLSSINRLVVRTTTQQELFDETARILVDEAGFSLAFVSVLDGNGEDVLFLATRSQEQRIRQLIPPSAPLPEADAGMIRVGPTVSALREGRTSVVKLDADDPDMPAWRQPFTAAGLRSGAAIPLIVDGAIFGAISMYSSNPEFFDDQELELLGSLTNDVAFGVHSRRREEQRAIAEQAVRTMEERLRLALRATNQGMFDVDMRSGAAYVSDEYVRMLGFDPATFQYSVSEWRHMIHPDDQDRVLGTFDECASGQRSDYQLEYRMRMRDGTHRWLLSMGAVIPDDTGGQPWRLIGTHIDLTERLAREHALYVAEQRFQLFMDHLPAFAFIKDKEKRLLFGNKMLIDLLERTPEDAYFKTNRELFPPKNAEEYDSNDELVFERMQPVVGEEHLEKNGRHFVFQSFKFPILQNDGEMLIGGIALDITARRTLERERELFFTMTSDLFCVADFDGTLRLVNKGWISAVGVEESEVLGKHFMDRVHPEDRAITEDITRRLRDGETVTGFVNRYRTTGDNYSWLSWNAVALPEERLFFGVAHNVTEQVIAAEQLREYNLQLKALSVRLAETEEAERRSLSRELHDDVGQSLTGLILNLNIIKNRMLPDSRELVGARLDDALRLVEETVNKTRNIMTALRPAMLDDYGLETALRWHADVMSLRMGIPIEFHAAPYSGDSRFDGGLETALYRIAQEALTNIMKHSHATRVTIRLSRSALRCNMRITDDGMGFDTNAAFSTSGRSSWGLITMRERIEAYGGSFMIDSGGGHGTVVEVDVPISPGS